MRTNGGAEIGKKGCANIGACKQVVIRSLEWRAAAERGVKKDKEQQLMTVKDKLQTKEVKKWENSEQNREWQKAIKRRIVG